MSNGNKVLVTGLGMVTALGLDRKTNWENLLSGKSGVDRITLFDPSDLLTQIAAQIPDDFENLAKKRISRRERKQMTRTTRMAIIAAKEAVRDSQIDFSHYDSLRTAVILGVVRTSYNEMERKHSEDHIIVRSMPNAPSAWISLHYGLEGPNFSVATACASSAYAICLGYDMIKSGAMDVVIVGGADSHIEYEMIKGFNQVLTLSINNDFPKTASCPFSKSRNGFVMGEGSGMLVLESEKSAKKRNAKIYSEIAGYSLTSETFHIVSLKEDGVGMVQTIEQAIKNAGIDKNDVSYINAHGTSTYFNDKYETMAIKNVFGKRAWDIPISSSKSMLGHTIGASGALEAIITSLSIEQGILTPTINYSIPDPELDLDYVPNESREWDVKIALSNSFGFGGHNSCIVFKKYD